MTIASTPSEISYAGDGVSTVFPIPFVFDTAADLKVIRTDADGNIQTLSTGFSVSGGGGSTGDLTLTAALDVGYTLTILDNPERTQVADYTSNDPFSADTHERALDRGVRISKRLDQLIKRCLRTHDGDPASGDAMLMPTVAARRGKFALWADTATAQLEPAVGLPVGTALSQSIIAELLTPQTQAESNAGVVPVDYTYPPGVLARYVTNTTPGTTDTVTGFQGAIDAADSLHAEVRFSQECGISKPLIIRSTTQQSISIKGNGKASAIIEPLAADISASPQNVNCCIFNANNNPHLHLENLRFAAQAAFTGVAIYCKESGGDDGSGQVIFSPVLRNIFCDLPSTNSGFLLGALQNAVVESCTWENAKGVFTIEGIGNADCHFANCSMYNSFDHFISQTADTEGSFLMHIDGLHAYNHNRGRLIDVQNWNGATISNVVLEPKDGNLGSVGIAKFRDCTNIIVTNCVAVKRTDVPQANIAFEIEGSSVKICNCKINAAIGLLVSGSSAVDIELDNCEFTESATACIQINGAASGTLRTRNCKFNSSQQRAILHSVVNSIDWYSENDEFLDAGLDGNAGRRNIDVATSGVVRLVNPTIGRTGTGAAAAYFIEAGGSGTVDIIHPRIVGTPPTGLKIGAQAVNITYQGGYGGTLPSAAALGLPNFGDVFVVSGTTNITSITATHNAGRRVTLIFQDVLTVTDGSNLALAGNFTTSADDSITLVCDGTNWYEVSRSAN